LKCRSEGLGWINVAHDRDLWLNLVNTVTSIWLLQKSVISWAADQLLGPEKWPYFLKYFNNRLNNKKNNNYKHNFQYYPQDQLCISATESKMVSHKNACVLFRYVYLIIYSICMLHARPSHPPRFNNRNGK